MGRTLAVALLVFADLSSTAAAPNGDGGPFADCEARLAVRSEGWASLCFLSTARKHQLWAEAKRRVAALLKSRPADPHLRFTLGFLELEGGSLPRAAELFRGAAKAFAGQADTEGEVLARLNLGECLSRQGLLEETGQAFQQAEAAARAAADSALLVRVKVRQAQLMRLQGGDLAQAHWILRQLEKELPEDAGYRTWKSLLYEKAVVLHRLGRHEEARRTNDRWAALARAAGEPYEEATALAGAAYNVAGQAPRSGTRDEAIRLAQVALEAAARVGNRSAAVTAHGLLGKLLPGAEGRPHLQECLRLTTAAKEPPQRAACLFALAGSLAAEAPEQARRVLDEALAQALDCEDPWTVAYGWAERFRVNWATLPRDEAAADSLAVLDLIEALRNLQESESGRAGFFTGWAEVYYSLAGHLLTGPGGPSPDELEIAFDVAERLRARVLLDSLAAARVPPPVDAALAGERSALLRELVRVHRGLQDPVLGGTERSGLLAELDALERDLAALEARFDVDDPKALPETRFATLGRTAETLAPDQALFAFLLAPDEDVYGKFAGGSWLLVLTNGGARVFRLPGRLDLEVKVEMFATLAAGLDDRDLELGSVTLYDDLLSAALADLPATVDELILVPDGVLHLLPFGLLRAHPQAEPLAESYHLSSVPSVTLWLAWRRQPEPPPAVLILADPAFLGSTGVPAAAGEPPTVDRQWALATGARLGRLPYAGREGRALLRRLGGSPSRLLVGAEASEGFLKNSPLDGFGAVHVAAHALVDVDRPDRSAVLLAAGGPDEDGLLQPREIAALGLTGKLVVLSACDSGSGQVLVGEGVQSLARAFFRAGARAVVASRWRLRDDDAAAFFDLFYRALADGGSVAGAAAAATRELRANGAPPGLWAGIVVLGDGGMVPLSGAVARPRWRTTHVVGVAVLLAAVLVVSRLSQRRLRRGSSR